jgi:hypothetical protein
LRWLHFEAGAAIAMTNDAYYAAIRRLGLKPTSVPGVFEKDGEVYSVPDGKWQTPEQRAETIEQIKKRFDVS